MSEPRIAPLPEDRWDPTLAKVVSATGPLNVFTTLGRHTELFNAWIGLGSMLLFKGTLTPRVRELAILRVASNLGCAYERGHHERIGREAGLTDAEIAALGANLFEHDWDNADWAVLAATDSLNETGTLGDDLWRQLSGFLDENGLIELVMLIGHYTMLAYALNAMNVQPES